MAVRFPREVWGHGRAEMLGSRRWLAAVLVVVGCFGAACGGSDFTRRSAAPPAPPAPPVPTTAKVPVVSDPLLQAALVHSVSRTADVRSARTSISVTVTGLGDDALAAGAFNIAGTGVVDFANGNADLSLSIPLFDRLGGGGVIEQRIVGRVVYTKLPARILRAGGLPATVQWLSLDPQGVGGEPTALSQAQADPAGQLAFVAAISTDVRRIGTASVRGVRSTHYLATIDLGPEGRGGRGRAAVGEKLSQLGALVRSRRLTVDVWVDGAGRARRVVVSVPLSPKSGAGAVAGLGVDATMRIQADFYAFGAPVRVAAPPRAQVRPFSTLRIGALNG